MKKKREKKIFFAPKRQLFYSGQEQDINLWAFV